MWLDDFLVASAVNGMGSGELACGGGYRQYDEQLSNSTQPIACCVHFASEELAFDKGRQGDKYDAICV